MDSEAKIVDFNLIEEGEHIRPRQKILFINAEPGGTAIFSIADMMLGEEAATEDELRDKFKNKDKGVDQFREMILSNIESSPKENERIEEREFKAKLPLPENLEGIEAIVIGGSRFAAYQRDIPGKELAPWKKELVDLIKAAVEKNIPMLGICFGEELLAEALGGQVVKMKSKEGKELWDYGWELVKKMPAALGDPVLKGLPDEFAAPVNNHDIVVRLPEGAVEILDGAMGVMGFRWEKKGRSLAWGLQFHPEGSKKTREKHLNEEKTQTKMREYGLEPEEIAKIGDRYDLAITKIFSNFRLFTRSHYLKSH